MPKVTIVLTPPGSFDPGGVVAVPVASDGTPVQPTVDGFRRVGSLVVWSGDVPDRASAVRFHDTNGWSHERKLTDVVDGKPVTGRHLTQDWGGPEALTYRDKAGRPVGGAVVTVRKDEPGPDATVVTQTVTTRDGRWRTPLAIPPGRYILVFEKPGLFGPDVVSLTVPDREV